VNTSGREVAVCPGGVGGRPEIRRLEVLDSQGWPNSAVAVGNFDGLHLGHQALVGRAVGEARRLGGPSVVLTLDPHPARILDPRSAPCALMTLDQKAEALGLMGADRLAVLPFTHETARMSAQDFASQVLVRAVSARCVVVGESFRFGRGREGGARELEALGESLGFEVVALPPVLLGGEPVSSSRVREALAAGDLDTAHALLGRPFAIDGRVVRGDGRGRTLGVPTANLLPDNEALPGEGVYACWACLEGEGRFPAVVNIGRRPTFGGDNSVFVEAHLLGFEGDAYERKLRLELQARIRAERRFRNATELVGQIRADVAMAAKLLEVR
jgi:riboflavin kinase/FMN adenylyltransferase